jgi:CRP/FNR family nitrogen fixation transcriptional regulator
MSRISITRSQLHTQVILGFSGARQIVLRNRQRLHNLDA